MPCLAFGLSPVYLAYRLPGHYTSKHCQLLIYDCMPGTDTPGHQNPPAGMAIDHPTGDRIMQSHTMLQRKSEQATSARTVMPIVFCSLVLQQQLQKDVLATRHAS